MRQTISEILHHCKTEYYFLHCDSWHFKIDNPNIHVINVGVQEPNMVNISLGLLLKGKNVIFYGIAGFVIEKCLAQLRLYFSDLELDLRSQFIFLEAGAHNEYPENLGIGHRIENIDLLCQYLKINKIDFYGFNKEQVKSAFEKILNDKTSSIIFLGNDL